jgi:hypothetical protein
MNDMTTDNFTYDVAFSFVQQDEGLAFELYKLLKDRLSCFIYSEQQKRLAGADGEQVFNSVFSKESRIVVVLFRNEWGNTKWTKIEETAIRNKGFDKGYEFVILIPTEDKFTPPDWLPKNRIWVGLERWGIESAASVIEARVQDFGGQIKIESISDRVARTEIEIKDKQKREQILHSQDGLTMAFAEVKNVIAEIKRHEAEIKSKATDWHIKVRDNTHNGCDIMSYGYYLTVQFYQQWANSSDGAYLFVALFKGYFDENGYASDPFHENKQIGMTRVQFDINEFNQNGWTLTETRKDFKTTNKLVEHWFTKLITLATEERMKRNY